MEEIKDGANKQKLKYKKHKKTQHDSTSSSKRNGKFKY